mgnify:CR=1 FL=1|jgi:hypothetical protein
MILCLTVEFLWAMSLAVGDSCLLWAMSETLNDFTVLGVN